MYGRSRAPVEGRSGGRPGAFRGISLLADAPPPGTDERRSRVEASRRVVGRVAGASDCRWVRVEAEVRQDGDDRVALVDFGDGVASSSAGASEDVLEIDSSQERGQSILAQQGATRLVRAPLGGGVWSGEGGHGADRAADAAPLAILLFFALPVFVGDSSAPTAFAGRMATTARRQDELGARTPGETQKWKAGAG